MKRLKIASDMDEVLMNYIGGFLDFCNRKFGKNLKKEDFDFYDVAHVLNISKEKARELIQEFEAHPDFDRIMPLEHSQQCMEYLASRHTVKDVITSRQLAIRNKTLECLEKHFGTLHLKTHFSGDIYSEQGRKKAEICQDLGIQILLEDAGKYALECAERGINVILFNKPYNSSCQHPLIIRVNGWLEVPKAIEEIGGRI